MRLKPGNFIQPVCESGWKDETDIFIKKPPHSGGETSNDFMTGKRFAVYLIKSKCRSMTLVPVGPVLINPPNFRKKV